MTTEELIFKFITRASTDPTLGPLHIALYFAIIVSYERQGCKSPISVQAKDLMRIAKIASARTYHKYMRDLKEANYIGYLPCYNPTVGSLVYVDGMESKGGRRTSTGQRTGCISY